MSRRNCSGSLSTHALTIEFSEFSAVHKAVIGAIEDHIIHLTPVLCNCLSDARMRVAEKSPSSPIPLFLYLAALRSVQDNEIVKYKIPLHT